MHHVFVESETAVHLWKYFGGFMGITHRIGPIKDMLRSWWNIKCKNAIHKLILHITPTVICWGIWKQRCSCKYGTQNSEEDVAQRYGTPNMVDH